MVEYIVTDFDRKVLQGYSNNTAVLQTAEEMLSIGATSDYIEAIDRGFRLNNVPTVIFPLPYAEITPEQHSEAMWDDNLNPIY